MSWTLTIGGQTYKFDSEEAAQAFMDDVVKAIHAGGGWVDVPVSNGPGRLFVSAGVSMLMRPTPPSVPPTSVKRLR